MPAGNSIYCIRQSTVPTDLDATGRWRDNFDIKLPPGYVVDETPDPVDLDLDFASYRSNVTAMSEALHRERGYTVHQVEISALHANDFRKLASTILMDERGNAVLEKAANPPRRSDTQM